MLPARERRILEAVCDALIPPQLEEVAPSPEEMVRFVEDFVVELPATSAAGFRAGLWALAGAARLSGGRAIEAQDRPARARLLQRLEVSRLAPIRLSLRVVCGLGLMALYSAPAVRAKLELPPVIQLSAPPGWVSDGRALPERLSVEVAVVGSGAGGAVAARHLADRGKEVLVIEEGAWAGRADFGRPAHEILRALYRDGGATPVLGFPGTPPIVLAEGRCVGGSTVVNGGTSWRTPPAALARWRREPSLAELSEAELSPYFDEVERELEVGPVTPDIAGRHNLIIADGAERLRWSAGWVRRNAAGCAGSGRCPFGCPRDAKRAMHLTYLPRAADRGARVVARLTVSRILVERGRAAGLEARDADGRRVEIRARNVVLAAGAIHSSLLLRGSGLDKSGQAGRHFIIHPIVKAVGLFDQRVEGWKGVVQGYYIDQFAADGILIMTGMVPPELLAFSLGPADHYQTMSRFAGALVIGAIVSDTSHGRVLGGRVTAYRQNRGDQDRMLRAVQRMAELLFASGATRVLVPLVHPHAIDSPSQIAGLAGPVSEVLTIHPMGTCRMGAVTDARGRVHGVPNLHVADASLLPSSIGVNPQLTIMALAARVADHL